MRKIFTIFLLILISKASNYSQNWEGLNSGTNVAVRSLFNDTIDNVLYVGGVFRYADSIEVNAITKWDGQQFFPLNSGQDNCSTSFCPHIWSIQRYGGEIFCGTAGQSMDGIPTKGLAKWDGQEWNAFGEFEYFSGNSASIRSQLVYNDELFLFGGFHLLNQDTVYSAVKWTGTQFLSLNFPFHYPPEHFALINSSVIFNGELYVGGNFGSYPSLDSLVDIARYDGENWYAVGDGIKGAADDVGDIQVFRDELYVCGDFRKSSGNAANGIMKLENGNWVDVGGSFDSGVTVHNMVVFNDALYAVGIFNYVSGGVRADNIARWDGEKWCGLGSEFNNRIFVAEEFDNDLYLGGGFEYIGQDTFYNIAKWIGGDYADTCGVIISSTLESKTRLLKFELFPNPVNNKLFFLVEHELHDHLFKVLIYDIYGQLILTQQDFNLNEELDVSNLSSGTYILQLRNQEEINVKKFVVH